MNPGNCALEDVEFGSIFIWENRFYLLPHQTYRVHPRYLDLSSQELVTIPKNPEVEVVEGRVGRVRGNRILPI